MIRLFPREETFLPQFNAAAQATLDAARVLDSMAVDLKDAEGKAREVKRLEHHGDKIAHETYDLLNRTWITPIDREDIHEINSSQETILNHIQAISNRICVYGLTRMRFPAQRMVENLKEMVLAIGTMVAGLDHKAEVTETVKRMKVMKKECEMLLLSGLGELYDNPNPTPAEVMDIIKWTHVYDRIDKAFNRAWQLAKAIEGIVLKNA